MSKDDLHEAFGHCFSWGLLMRPGGMKAEQFLEANVREHLAELCEQQRYEEAAVVRDAYESWKDRARRRSEHERRSEA